MGSIIISKAYIQCHRFSQNLSLTDQIIHSLHQLHRSWERIFSRYSHFYNNDVTGISSSPVYTSGGSAISRRNTQYGSPMTAEIPFPYKKIAFLIRKRQGTIDLFSGIFYTSQITFRRILSWFRLCTLIPQTQNPAGAILIAKVRVSPVHPRIHDSHKNPFSRKSSRVACSLHRSEAGGIQPLPYLKVKPFGKLNKFHLWMTCKFPDFILRK